MSFLFFLNLNLENSRLITAEIFFHILGRTNHISSPNNARNTQNPTDNSQSKTTANKGGNLSTDSSSDSSIDRYIFLIKSEI